MVVDERVLRRAAAVGVVEDEMMIQTWTAAASRPPIPISIGPRSLEYLLSLSHHHVRS